MEEICFDEFVLDIEIENNSFWVFREIIRNIFMKREGRFIFVIFNDFFIKDLLDNFIFVCILWELISLEFLLDFLGF